jgi:hypothetical protein
MPLVQGPHGGDEMKAVGGERPTPVGEIMDRAENVQGA